MKSSITTRISILLLVPFIGAVLALAVFYVFFFHSMSDAPAINILSRQQMLSEQLFIYADMVHMGQADDRVVLQKSIEKFDNTVRFLAEGDEIKGHQVIAHSAAIMSKIVVLVEIWIEHKKALEQIAQRPVNDIEAQRAFAYVKANNRVLTEAVKNLELEMEEHSLAQNNKMVYVLVAIACFDFALLVAGIMLIKRYFKERKVADTALQQSKERMDLILQGTQDGIWDWDLVHDQIYFSARWKQMLGYGENEIKNDFFVLRNLIHPDDLDTALEVWMNCKEGENNLFTIEYRLKNKRGEYIWIMARGLTLFDENGNPVRVAGSHTDITERKQAFAKLEKINSELDQFAYLTSHDLKAPLRAISNLSKWIEEDLDAILTTDTRKQMTLLRGRVSRMEGLINGILQYSRAGRVNMEKETVDVGEMLNEIIDGLDVNGTNIEIDSDMPVLETARIPLMQVFSNIISNAIKYNDKDNGHIHISVRSEDCCSSNFEFRTEQISNEELNNIDCTCYEFSFADNGPGIADEYHERIFKIFQTLQSRDEVESTGVGLALVKKITEELGGCVKLESKEGQGTVFRIILPQSLRPISVDNRLFKEMNTYVG